MIKKSPGPLAPPERSLPSLNTTALSYSWTTLTLTQSEKGMVTRMRMNETAVRRTAQKSAPLGSPVKKNKGGCVQNMQQNCQIGSLCTGCWAVQSSSTAVPHGESTCNANAPLFLKNSYSEKWENVRKNLTRFNTGFHNIWQDFKHTLQVLTRILNICQTIVEHECNDHVGSGDFDRYVRLITTTVRYLKSPQNGKTKAGIRFLLFICQIEMIEGGSRWYHVTSQRLPLHHFQRQDPGPESAHTWASNCRCSLSSRLLIVTSLGATLSDHYIRQILCSEVPIWLDSVSFDQYKRLIVASRDRCMRAPLYFPDDVQWQTKMLSVQVHFL